MVFLIIIAFAVIGSIEIPGLVRKKLWRELIVFSILLSLGFSLSVYWCWGLIYPISRTRLDKASDIYLN
jgi:hypothetical protein